MGLPYRDDGTVDENGRYSLFATPEKTFPSPGLNCSGFVVSASRFMLRRNITTAQAVRDRLGDSGPDSPKGQDWDFGWDLILNASEGSTRTLLLPGGATADPASRSGTFRGYDLHDPATWKELRARMKPGKLYLVSFSKETTRKGYTLMHYHVGFILPTERGELWLYQTTPEFGKVNRRDLGTQEGLASFLRSFANTGKVRKMIAVLEVALPGSGSN